MNLDSSSYRILGWLGSVLMTVAAVYLLVVGRWQGAAVMAGFLVGTLTLIGMKDQLPSIFTFLVVLAALANGAGWVWNLFRDKALVWYDEVVHGFTMAVIGLAVAFYIHYRTSRGPGRTHPGIKFVVMVTGAALLLGGVWEVVEWLFNVIGSTWDTFVDLLMDTLGGLVAGLFAAWAVRHEPPRQLRETDRPHART